MWYLNFTEIATLNQLAEWFLALQHAHYPCWLRVCITDMVALKSIYHEL